MRRWKVFERQTAVSHALLEHSHGADCALAEISWVGLIECVAQARHQLQQWGRFGDERVDPDRHGFDAVDSRSDWSSAVWRGTLVHKTGRAPAAGDRANDRSFSALGLGKGVVAHAAP
jgi:hypothetical protein